MSSLLMSVTKAELRKFAWVMGGALSVFGALAFYRGKHATALLFFSAAGLFLIFGLLWPVALGPVYRAWMFFGRILAWINTRIILGLLFYLLLTPVSLFLKLIRRDVLNRKIDRSRSTYWHLREKQKPAKERYEHLY